MENPIFVDDENISLVTHHHEGCEGDHDDDYNDCNTPITKKADEGTFTTPSSTNKQRTSISGLRQKLKQDKLTALYRHLNVTGNLDLIMLINLTRNYQKGNYNFRVLKW